jgi:hypothetical protein
MARETRRKAEIARMIAKRTNMGPGYTLSSSQGEISSKGKSKTQIANITNDRKRTAARATAIANRETKIAQAKKLTAKEAKKAKIIAANRKPSNVIGEITKRFGITAREARDIATAIGGIKDVVTNKPGTTARGGKPRQLKNAVKNVVKQVKETGTAAKTGERQRPAKRYQTSMGDNPAGFYTQKKRKF